jgi:hypothetical protein
MMTDPRIEVDPRMTDPPDGRWWRVQLWRRYPFSGKIAELSEARSRSLHLDLRGPARFAFTIDGRSLEGALMAELTQDVVALRWNPVTAAYDIAFRGPIAQIEDVLSETVHSVNVTAGDYRAMLDRRLIYSGGQVYDPIVGITPTVDQAVMVRLYSVQLHTGGLGLNMRWGGVWNPDGTYRSDADTGTQRQRVVQGGETCATWIDQLSAVEGGFDWSVEPVNPNNSLVWTAEVRVWYPRRGTTKQWVAEYGVTVGNLTRTARTSDFANYIRVSGASLTTINVPGQPATTVPIFAVYPDTVGTEPDAVGFWQSAKAQPDVMLPQTLREAAIGYWNVLRNPQPSYTLDVIPRRWHSPADCWLGDTIPLRINSGRLTVDDVVRIVGLDWQISDNNTDVLSLTCARPLDNFATMSADTQKALAALARR